ncbi:MAG TPA: LysM peptidoglycan-binding domain-containing protein [Actinomycetota bacterium]|nr:LysM peptidoglycan-binding domain-containing protein [Actinomycetota bacterium]
MAKAYLEFEEWAAAAAGGAPRRIEFQFNPKEFSVKQGAHWVEVDGSTASEYVGPRSQHMSVGMFLDASDAPDGDVSAQVDTLLAACHPTPASSSKSQPLPPRVRFGWDRVHFEGYVSDVDVHYRLFHPDGRPIRAECTIEMQEIERPTPRQNPTSGTPEIHRTVAVVAGDTLAGLAYREYGDPARWRAIAELNGVDDPLRVRPGTRLLLPPAHRLREAS